MGFPTMKKAMVEEKILTAGDKEKFFSKVKSVCGDNLAKLNEARTLYSDAFNATTSTDKKVKIVGPYAKVGVVDGQLVFRVKHKGGHYGTKDIVLAANYVEAHAEPELKESKKGEVMGKLTPGGKPELTAAWWVKTRGSLSESSGLEKILQAYEVAKSKLEQKQNFANHNEMAEVIRKLSGCAINVYKSYQTFKNDEAILKVFLAQVKDAKSYYENKAERYSTEVKKQVEFNQGDARGIFKLERIDEQIKDIVKFLEKPTKAAISEADGMFLGFRANLANAEKAIKNYKRNTSDRVDDADVRLLEGDSLQKILLKGQNELKNRQYLYEKLEGKLEKLVDKALEEDAKVPKDPTYKKLLDEVLQIYDKVTLDLRNLVPTATQVGSNTAKNVVLPTSDEEIAGVLNAIAAEEKKIAKVKADAAEKFSSTRQQGEGSTKAKGLKREDLIYTRKRTTEAKMVNKQINASVNVGLNHMLSILSKIELMPGAKVHSGQIGTLKTLLEKGMGEMNAF